MSYNNKTLTACPTETKLVDSPQECHKECLAYKERILGMTERSYRSISCSVKARTREWPLNLMFSGVNPDPLLVIHPKDGKTAEDVLEEMFLR